MVSTSGHKADVATLLHLSDLHFGTPEGKGHFWNSEGSDPEVPAHDQRRLFGRLVADLERQPTPDIVVVSGDLLDKAERNQMVDIVGLADDLLDGSPAYQGESRTKFAVRARWLITRLALAVPVSPSGALAAELVEPHGRIASAPLTTHLLVAILMAQGQGSRAVLLH